MAALLVTSVESGLSEEPVRIVEEEFLLRILFEAGPRDDVVDRLGELAFRVGIVGGVHQNVIAEEVGDIVEHVLPLVVLDAAEEPTARHVFAWLLLERRSAADIDRLLVHAPGPERQPTKAAFEHAHPQFRVFVEKPAADERADKPHGPPRMGGEPTEED